MMTTQTRLPPSPPASRSWQTLNWLVRPYPYLDACYQRFGRVFTLRLHAFGDLVMLSDPDDVADLFRMSPDDARAGEANELITPVVGSESLFVLDGEPHARRRAELRASLTTRPPIDPDVVNSLTLAELPSGGGEVAANTLFRWLAMRLSGYQLFGTASPDVLRPLAEQLQWLLGPIGSVAAFFPPLQRDLGPASFGYWFHRRIKAADAALADAVRQATALATAPSTVERLCRARGGGSADLLEGTLRDDVVTMIVAGDDAMASAMSWTLFWIARTPRVQKRLLDSLPPGATPEQILDDDYLTAACQEALRITPVLDMVARTTTVPVSVAGFDIPVGSLLSAALYLVHRNESIYPDAASYRPERFLERSYRPSEFIPFGGGVRRCIGANLALFELRLVIGTILANYQVVPANPEAGELRYARRNVTVAPADPLLARLTPRKR